jgi:hypothetical protein
MATGKLGADSLLQVTSENQGTNLIQLSQDQFGVTWFFGSGTSTVFVLTEIPTSGDLSSGGQPHPSLTNCSATPNVNGSGNQGSIDAEAKVEDLIIGAFGSTQVPFKLIN